MQRSRTGEKGRDGFFVDITLFFRYTIFALMSLILCQSFCTAEDAFAENFSEGEAYAASSLTFHASRKLLCVLCGLCGEHLTAFTRTRRSV